jgi:hypothetical protein
MVSERVVIILILIAILLSIVSIVVTVSTLDEKLLSENSDDNKIEEGSVSIVVNSPPPSDNLPSIPAWEEG